MNFLKIQQTIPGNILDFIHLAERLKTEKRNGHTSQNSRESVADHCWRVSLMAILLAPYLDEKINIEKTLKLAIIHDLPEIVTGDRPYYHYLDESSQKQKKERESLAIKKLTSTLPEPIKSEIQDLWNEFEKKTSPEALFVHALDKMEAQIQHNQASIDHWNEFDFKFAPTLLNPYCNFDSFLTNFKDLIQTISKEKISS